MEKDSFVFYKSFYKAISKVKNKKVKADLYDAICELGFNDNVVDLDDDIGQMIMDLIKPQMIANNKRKADGKKGGRPKKIKSMVIENENHTYEKNESMVLKNNNHTYEKNESMVFEPDLRKKENKEKERSKEKEIKEKKEKQEKERSEESLINFCTFIESNFVRTLASLEYEFLKGWLEEYGEDITHYAFEIAIMQNKKSFSYVNGILKNWKTSGYKTLEEIKGSERVCREKGIVPNWLDKEIVNKELDEETCKSYEEFINFLENFEKFKCEECGEIKPNEDMGESELAKNDRICKLCMADGYGS